MIQIIVLSPIIIDIIVSFRNIHVNMMDAMLHLPKHWQYDGKNMMSSYIVLD